MSDGNANGDAVTVSVAAARLGVTEPRLRRLLARPDFAGFTRQQARDTRTGTRTATVVPVSVLPDLREVFEKSAAQEGQGKRERPRGEALASVAYETALRERERLLAEKDARIAELTAALEHEREQSRALVLALAREQTLRLLPTVGTAQATTGGAENAEVAAEPPREPEAPENAAQGARQGLWGRLFGRQEG